MPVYSSSKTDPEGPAFKVLSAKNPNRVTKKFAKNNVPPAGMPEQTTMAALPSAAALPKPISRVRKIALLLPLSGQRARLGRELLDSAQIAVFDRADGNFAILPFDTKGTVDGAAVAASRAIEAGAELILGPLLASSVKPVRQVASNAGISIVSFSNSRDVAGDGVFILGFVPRQQVEAIIEYAVSKRIYRYAALAPDNGYGRAVVAALKEVVKFHQGVVVRVEFYDPVATDLTRPTKAIADYDRRHKALIEQRDALAAREDEVSRQALKRLEKLDTFGKVDYDAVLLPGSGQQLKAIASLLSYYDVDRPAVRLLGLSNWAQTANIESEPSLRRGWYAAPPAAERKHFLSRYREIYGRPPAAIASLAYDATALAIVLAQSHQRDHFSKAHLIQSHGFLGVDGLFRLRDEGAAERVFEIREVNRNGFAIRRAAQTAFPLAGR
ncbi:MAG: penicillin-binding protein activator [Pseudomonadota bacterium]|nr:penicillin-binding protein activator [Pseudomonadota bacterium]